MNSKKSNGHRQDQAEQMLISYAGAAMESDDSEHDFDHVQPLDLPPTKLRRPKSRKRNGPKVRNCCSLWNFCQIFFIVFILASTICVVWFTLILKSSMESMKTRITQLESMDRSTSREYAELQKNLDGQMVKLKHNQDGVAALDKQHFLSVLAQLAHLNRTVDYLNEKVKSPQSATKINQDIELLKNGMADINQEITQVKDQVAQLKTLASSQHSDIADLKERIWNLTAQVVHLTGKPMPVPPKVTPTAPLILRVPVQSDLSGKEQSNSNIFKNLTARFALEIGHVRGYITSINSSFASRIDHLETKMEGLVKSIRDHMVQVDELSKEMDSFKILEATNKSKTDGGHFPVKLEKNKETAETHNFSVLLTRMVQNIDAHGQKLSLLMSEMTLMNHSIHHQEVLRSKGEEKQTSVSCNCSGIFKEVRKMLDADEKKLSSLRAELDQLKLPADEEEYEGQSAGSVADTSPTTLPPTATSSESVAHATKNASDTVTMHKEAELEEGKLEGEIPEPTKGVTERATTIESSEAVPQNSTENAEMNEKITNAQQNTTLVPVLGEDNTEPLPTAESTESEAEEEETILEDES